MEDQLRHRQRPVSCFAKRDESVLRHARQMRVVALLFAHRAFPLRISPARLVIVASEEPRFVGKRQNPLDRLHGA